MWNLMKIGQAVSEKFKEFIILYLYIAKGQADNPSIVVRMWGRGTTLIIQCKFQPLNLNT